MHTHHYKQTENTYRNIWRPWDKGLKAATKAYNILINQQTSYSPYEITHGHYPQTEFNKKIQDRNTQTMHDRIHINLTKAHDTMKETHSKINENQSIKFNPGDKVLLLTKIQRLNMPDKLQAC
jgi:hypothetical protein